MSFNLSSAPFSSTSLWNRQVNTGATYTPLNWPTSTGSNYGVTWSQTGFPVYVASSSDPVVQVSVPASWGWPGGTVSVHVPAGATGAPGGTYGSTPADNPIIVVDGDIAYNFWRFSRTSDTTATAQAYGEANVVTGTGWGYNGVGAGVGAAGNSELGGLLVQAQTDTGTINHALEPAVANNILSPGYIAPAIASDGYSSTGITQEGRLLGIPPGTPMPSGLSPLGQEVFRALQQYGAYVTERGGDQTVLRAQANAYNATTINALNTDLNKLLPLLNAVSGGSPSGSSGSSSGTPTVTPAVTQATASPATGIEQAGNTITLSLGFNEAVTVTGTPTLALNDGNTATYVGGSGTSTLTFKTTVAATDTNTSALAITGVNLANGASIKDASGLAANLSGAVKTFTGLQIDPILPAVTQATASPATGTELAGDTITLSLGFNEAVTVSGTPTLSLNDGGTATYVGGSGTGTLTFRTTVASTDTSTSALAITGVNLANGASIHDASGVAANLAGAVKTFSGLQIDPPVSPPPVLPAVTQATASPATGTEVVGNTITLALGFNEAVTVTGTPTLSLNDGGTASYVSGSGTGTLTFRTTVASTDTNTSALAITGVNLANGASIHDASGAAANLAGAVKTFSGLQVATSSTSSTPSSIAPVLTVADSTLSVAGRGGTVGLGVNVTTTDPNDAVTVNIAGLPKYETITDKLDGRTFSGNNVTLTAAQVDSGLTLQSNYRGGAHPVATLALTANAKDPVTGAVTTAAPQTITVTDPRPAATTTTTSRHHPATTATHHHATTATHHHATTATHHHATAATHHHAATATHHHAATATHHHATTATHHHATAATHHHATAATHHLTSTVTNPPSSTSTSSGVPTDHVSSPVATTVPKPITVTDPAPATDTTTASPAGQGLAWLNQHQDQAASTGATKDSQPIAATDPLPATVATTGSLANHGFALLQQYMDPVTGAAPISLPQTSPVTDSAPATGKAMASLASQSFALLNQYMAGNTGRVDPGQIVAAVSQGAGWGQDSFLTRPQH